MKSEKRNVIPTEFIVMKSFVLIVVSVLSLCVLCLFLPEIAASQPPPPPPPPNYNQEVPIDGGLGILAAAGVSYAIHKLRKKES